MSQATWKLEKCLGIKVSLHTNKQLQLTDTMCLNHINVVSLTKEEVSELMDDLFMYYIKMED